MKKHLKCLLLAVVFALALSAMAPAALAADAPASTSNIGDHEYSYNRWANPIKSYLVPHDDGTLSRVEYTSEAVAVETYDSALTFVSGTSIEMELPIFGGFYYGEDYNFLVFGQKNPNEDDAQEVVRVVSYTKDWERVGAASLYGANTTDPFDAGSLRFAEYGGYLYIRTAHEMYMSDDGYNHQSNMTLNVRISDMTITDSFYNVMSVNYGYVSHSFNQFIAVDGTDLVAVDHGDAHPRSVVLIRYNAPAGQDKFMVSTLEPIGGGYYQYVYAKNVNVLPIAGSTGANDTGVALGGFEISDTAYLIAGNTVSQGDDYDAFGQRNVFISATTKGDLSSAETAFHYLTSYADGDGITVSNPHFVKVEDNKYMILWTESGSETSGLRYAFVGGNGELLSDIYTNTGVLSDCQPIVSGGKLIWYATSASVPAFFTIDLSAPGTVTHDHVYTYSYVAYPGYYSYGSLSCVCAICGLAGEDVTIPAIDGSSEYTIARVDTEPTCTESGYGYYRWNKLPNYDVTQYIFGGAIPALGHEMTYTAGIPATCVAEGTLEHWDCSRCGLSFANEAGGTELTGFAAPVDPENHTGTTGLVGKTDASCTSEGYTGDTVCADCGAVITEGSVVAMLEHQYNNIAMVPASCTAGGYTTVSCGCGDSYVTDRTEALGHKYEDGVCVRCGAPLLGDLDGDKELTIADMAALKSVILTGSPSEETRFLADVNEDGKVSVLDIIRLKGLILAADPA